MSYAIVRKDEQVSRFSDDRWRFHGGTVLHGIALRCFGITDTREASISMSVEV